MRQAKRILRISSPIGDDKLFIDSFSCIEYISNIFECNIGLFSDQLISPKDIVGKQVTLTIQPTPSQIPRYLNGYVSSFQVGSVDMHSFRHYKAVIRPWLWFLSQASDCQVFQEKSVVEICEAIFKRYGFSDYSFRLGSAEPKAREYCVQYNETALNFVLRLLEEEGMFYYFDHADGKHTLVISNDIKGYDSISGVASIRYVPGNNLQTAIQKCSSSYSYVLGKYSSTDYNYEKPSDNLLSSVSSSINLDKNASLEKFFYPACGKDKSEIGSVVQYNLDAEESRYQQFVMESDMACLAPGKIIEMDTDDASISEKKIVISKVRHEATDYSHLPGSQNAQNYSNELHALPSTMVLRPFQSAPRPIIAGLQSAVVTGKSGEEIYTDKYGRVKIQFYWDRQGKKDENTSCWVRVAQSIAGKNWGSIYIPRVGQEVTVSFINGNPDRPLVVGVVYNGENGTPYDLPSNMTQSGIKSHSTKEGVDTANEIRFEDKKDSEELYVHAQKDFNALVENDNTLTVNNDRTVKVKNDLVETVEEGNHTCTTEKGTHTLSVKQGDRIVEVAMGDDKHSVKQGKRVIEVSQGDHALNISMGNQTTQVKMGKSTTEAMSGIELKVGANSILIDQTGITIKGLKISLQGQVMTEVTADAMLKLQGSITTIN